MADVHGGCRLFRTKGVDIEEFKRLNPRDIAGGKKKRKRRVGGGAEAAAAPKGARPEAEGAGAGDGAPCSDLETKNRPSYALRPPRSSGSANL